MRNFEESGATGNVRTTCFNLVELLGARAYENAAGKGYVFLGDGEIESGRLTFADLDRRARAIAARLQTLGMIGERALLLYPPGLEYIEAFFGCLYAGAIAVPAYPPTRQHLPRLQAVMRDAAPGVIMTTAELVAKFRDEFVGGALCAASNWLATDAVASGEAGRWRAPVLAPESLAFLQYTSGSTGDPKGVMVSHGNLLANQEAIRQSFGHTEHSTVVGWLPLYHDMGLIGNILQPLYVGSTAVLMSPMAFLEKPVRWLKAISEYRAATSGGPNFAYDLCVRKVTAEQKRGLDLSAWTLAFNGSEPVRAATLERFAGAFAECGFRRESFFPCYGLAEATLFVTGTGLETGGLRLEEKPDKADFDDSSSLSPPVSSLVSCGLPADRHIVQIVDPNTGKPCLPGREGEIWVSGPSVAQGYWNCAEESENTFRARLEAGDLRPDKKGTKAFPQASGLQPQTSYLRTGDLGLLDDGRLYVTGRIKDLIIIRGRNYYPQDIEHALTDSVDVLRPGGCAAFSVTCQDEEKPIVVAELTREAIRKADYEAIFASLRSALAEICELTAAELVLVRPGGVPKTSSGKLRRQACKQAYLEGALPVLARSDDPKERGAQLAGQDSSATSGGTRKASERKATPQEFQLQLLQEALSVVPQPQRAALISRFLRTRIAHLLKIEESAVSVESPLRASGLDSLKAVELKHTVDELLGIEAPLTLFLSDRSAVEVAEALAGQTGDRTAVEEDEPASPCSSLSATQLSMWTMQHMEPDSIVYNLHLALRIENGTDAESLRRSFYRLAERHDMLRTVYRNDGDEVFQSVLPLADLPDFFTAVDASAWSESELQDDMARQVREPFDLAQGPVLRVVLYRQGTAEPPVLLLCAHHIALDLWSVLILVDELRKIHSERSEASELSLPPSASNYAAFAAWQQSYLQSPVSDADWDYWRQQLAGELPILALPTDRPRPAVPDYRGASVAVRLSREETGRLRELAGRSGVTLFTLLLAAYKVLLHRYTRQTDLIVGVPTSGRSQARFASVAGNFVNPVPLRSHPSGDKLFSVYLAEVHEALLGALEHQDYPFSLMVERLNVQRDADHWPVYQTLFVLQQAQTGIGNELAQLALGEDGEISAWSDWPVRPLAIRKRVENFDLKLMAAECDEELLFSFQYRSDLFEPVTIARLAHHFEILLGSIAAGPRAPLGDLPLLSEAERQRMLAEWNATANPGFRAQTSTLSRLFEVQAEKTPEATAVIFGNRRLTYRELNACSNRLAHALIAAGIAPDTPVGICARRSLEMVIGLLGILKAGGAYLPLDPNYPAERLSAMLSDAKVSLILTQPEFVPAFPDFAGTVLSLNAGLENFAGIPEHNPNVPIGEEILAYVLFTSGSTGRPKGVGISHKAVRNRLLWMQDRFGLDATDAVLQKTPFTFDVSVWEFFWPLIAGSRLIVAAPGDHREPERLVDLIERHSVTTVHFVPSMLGAFLESADLNRCASLRRVICSGEALTADLQNRFVERSAAELHNLYGPTEAAIDVTAWDCGRNRAERTVSIGRPIANTKVYLLDDRLNPVPVGVAGELYIGGIQLARGYLNRPDLTAERFVPDPFARLEAGDLRLEGKYLSASSSSLTPQVSGRLYRTGDLARYRPDGAIEYLGRIDHQVKIRGFRIELGEIEARLLKHPAVNEAAVVVRGENPDERQIVAYWTSAQEPASPADALQFFLKEALPEYMIPAAFMRLDRLPVTANGKLDRKALPAPDLGQQFAYQYVAPRDPAEECLANIWADLLGIERIGIHDNFFALGGDSIRAIQVASRAHRAGWPITPRMVFQYQTVAELAEAAERAGEEERDGEQRPNAGLRPAFPLAELDPAFPLAELDPAELDGLLSLYPDIEDIYPLAPMQEGLLFHSLLNPDSGIYLMQDRYQIESPVDAEAFRQAWQGVVDHHPILRTSFFWESRQRAHQIVHRQVRVPFEYFDWRDLSDEERREQMDRLLAEELREGFDFSRAPLFRVRLFRFEEARYRFVRSYHHILLDEWCTSEILSHFLANYEALLGGRELPARRTPPFRDYIAWLGRQNGRNAEAFWRRDLDGFSEPTPLSVDRPVADDARAAGEMDEAIDFLTEDDTRALAALAQRRRVTANTFLQAAWALVLSHYSGRDDVVYGVTVAGRPAELPGVEKILGLFINSLPLRVKVAPDLSVADFLQQLLQHNLDIRRYEYTSLVTIQSWIGLPHDRPLFDSLLVFENAPIDQALLEKKRALKIAYEKNRTHTNYPITVVVIPGPKLHLQITYQRARFDRAAIERMLGHFKRLLEGMIRNPAARLIDLPVLTEAEQRWVDDVHRTVSAPLACSDFSLGFATQVRRAPDAVAVACGGQRATYAELNARTDRLAQALAARGVGSDVVVALLDDRGVDLLAMILAVLKAGGAYLPLDPGHPDARLAQILRESRVGLLLAGNACLERARSLAERAPSADDFGPAFEIEAAVLCLADLDAAPPDGQPLPLPPHPERLAYVIYTSGSTGTPKGAMVEHRGMLNNLLSKIPAMDLNAADVIAQTASQCFDISVWQFLTGLLCGARVEILPDTVVLDPGRLLDEIAARGVTVLEAVPSLIRALLDVPESESRLKRLRWLLPTGETFPPELCRRWMDRHPHVRLLNAYGPAECSDDVAYHFIADKPAETETVMPIGRPLPNLRLHIVDRWLRPVPAGVPGELCVSGVGVGRGYLNRPDLTAERFVPNPFAVEPGERLYRTGDQARYRADGVIEFLGRIDHQVKIRGYRVEPSEIEAQLFKHPLVKQTVVVAREDRSRAQRLVAYVVPEAGAKADVEPAVSALHGEMLREFLERTLPGYMIPSLFLTLERMPLTPNGKIDRKALPEPEACSLGEHHDVPPRNPAEERLADIWKEVLGIERVGITDNFFDLGGHSLLAVQVLSRVRAVFGIDLALRSLFEAPTVARLALLVEEALIEKLDALSDDEAESLLQYVEIEELS
ncbi:amino acid adenylation domain-containing protein [Methylocaldum sp. MU1018]